MARGAEQHKSPQSDIAIAQAATMVRADCTVRAERTPVAYEFCPKVPVDVRVAQEFLRAVAPVPELERRAV